MCSDHFVSGKHGVVSVAVDIAVCKLGKPAPLYDITNPDWTPSKSMGYSTSHGPDEQKYARLQQ